MLFTPTLRLMASNSPKSPETKSPDAKSHEGYLDQQILIAMPGMVDDNFSGSVTLMCQHDAQGAIGITINRVSEFTLGEILNQLDIQCADDELRKMDVLAGGPVAPDRGFVVHSPRPGYESSMKVGETMMVTTSRDVLADIAVGEGPEKFIVALGYAGWGEGQLEGEMLANAWLSVNADTEIVFDRPVHDRFDLALGRLGVHPESLHSQAGHA